MYKFSSYKCLFVRFSTVFSMIVAFSLLTLNFSIQAEPVNYWQFERIQNSLAKSADLSARQDVKDDVEDKVLRYAEFSLNPNALQAKITASSSVIIDIPLPNGELIAFELMPVIVMAPKLAEKYPNIKTFSGYQIGKPNNRGRFDFTPLGFHGMFSQDSRLVYVEPKSQQNQNTYISFFRDDSQTPRINDVVIKHKHEMDLISSAVKRQSRPDLDDKLLPITTYRLAMSASGEYTAFHGGTVESGLAAVVTMVNRLNEIYLRELAIQFELIANNDVLIFTNAATDPFANNDNDGETNTQVTDDAIGSANYDLGHVVNTGAGGLASVGALCRSFKGDGVTGRSSPVGDSFWVDYVAHEIGHQLGADHIFNGTTSSCDSGRSQQGAYEPGSGTTIMSYAGICGSQNIENRTSEFYHAYSIEEMNTVIANRSCGTTSVATNHVPSVDAGSDYVIPANTPFELTGSATDLDSDSLTYEWHQFDTGTATSTRLEDQTDQGDGPLFRVFEPVEVPTRVLPQLSSVLNSSTTYGETIPTTNRDINFRFLVRDNRGGVNYDDMHIQVVDTGEAFAVTSPLAGTLWSDASQEVTWNVAGTVQQGINCATVDIWLSDDAGQSFSHKIADGVANSGSASVVTAGLMTNQARVKVKCSNNIFFAVNNGTFEVNVSGFAITDQQPAVIDEDSTIIITSDLLTVTGGVPEQVNVLAGSHYQVNNNTVTPDTDFFGQLSVPVTVTVGGVESDTFDFKVTVSAVNDLPVVQNDSAEVEMNSSDTLVDVLMNDSDVEQEALTLISIDYQGTGTAAVSSNQVSYTPPSGFTGTENIVYVVQDATGGQSSATLTITVVDNSSGGSGGNSGSDNTPPQTPPTSNNNDDSSGGSFSWLGFLALCMVQWIRSIQVSFPPLKRFIKTDRLRKVIMTSSLLVFMVGCSQSSIDSMSNSGQANPINESEKAEQTMYNIDSVTQDVNDAVNNKDTRLLASSGRRVALPGIPVEQEKSAMERCGFKFMPKVTDMVKSAEDKAQRKQTYQYMQAYNQLMYKRCGS